MKDRCGFDGDNVFGPRFDEMFRKLDDLFGKGTPEWKSTEVGVHGIVHDDTGSTYQALIPGATREDVTIKVEKGSLQIDVTYKLPLMQGGEEYTFKAKVRLQDEHDTAKIDAKCVNGVLTVKIPFRKTAKIKPVDIKVG